MSQVKTAVLELTSAVHNWREKQGPQQLDRVILAADALAGYALQLEKGLELITDTSPMDRCKCGGVLVACALPGASVPITKCTSCAALFAVVSLTGGVQA